MISFPKYNNRSIHILDGLWDFAFIGEDISLETLDVSKIRYNDRIHVPGVYDAVGTYVGKRGTAAYKRTISVSPMSHGRIHFYGLGMWAKVYVDGKSVAEWALPYSEYWIDVEPSTSSEREIVVLIDNRFDDKRVPLCKQYYDFYFYGGIYRSVEWHETSKWYIDRVQIQTIDVKNGRIRATLLLGGTLPKSVQLSVGFDAASAQDKGLCRVEQGRVVLDLSVPNPQEWSPETPNLHELFIQADNDSIVERFGLRVVSKTENDVCVNGRPVKLLGYCRHEAHLQFGPALPLAQLVQDLQLLRDLGCNFIRGSHYPQDPRFLDLCDELGFLVFEETLGWGNRPEHFNDIAFCRDQETQARLMVRKSINHPSVIIWGFLNEGSSKQPECSHLYQTLAKCIREEDTSRLVTYASMFPFDDVNYDTADVISINQYPGWYAHDREKVRPLGELPVFFKKLTEHIDSLPGKKKPIIISEIGAGAIYGWRDIMRAHWSEEYQADYLEIVCKEIVSNSRFAGVSLWQFCDCRTYASAYSLGRPRGINDKGTVDEYRRPKLAYELVKGIFQRFVSSKETKVP